MQFAKLRFKKIISGRKKLGKNIYIVPTFSGAFLFLFGVILFGVAAIKRNEVLYLYGFSLLSIFVVAMLQTHANLKISAPKISPLVNPRAGEEFSAEVQFAAKVQSKQIKFRVYAHTHTEQLENVTFSLLAHSQNVKLKALSRGSVQNLRIAFSSRYPFGLFYVWRFFDVPVQIQICPARFQKLELPLNTSSGHSPESLKPYAKGENSKRILWKRYSPHNILKVRSFEENSQQPQILDFLQTDSISQYENRISQLFSWHLELQTQLVPHSICFPGMPPQKFTFQNSKQGFSYFANLPFENQELKA
jgi:hypothetical protein